MRQEMSILVLTVLNLRSGPQPLYWLHWRVIDETLLLIRSEYLAGRSDVRFISTDRVERPVITHGEVHNRRQGRATRGSRLGWIRQTARSVGGARRHGPHVRRPCPAADSAIPRRRY